MKKRNVIISLLVAVLALIVIFTATAVCIVNKKVVYHNENILSIKNDFVKSKPFLVVETPDKNIYVNVKRIKTITSQKTWDSEKRNIDRDNGIETFILYYYPNNTKRNMLIQCYSETEAYYEKLCY